MTFTENDAYAAHLADLTLDVQDHMVLMEREQDWLDSTGIPVEYQGLTPSEQAEQVDADWREEFRAMTR